MIIISPFKDYYDYVAHNFGGGDPKILYTRTFIHRRTFELHYPVPRETWRRTVTEGMICRHQYAAVVIVAEPILIERKIITPFVALPPENSTTDLKMKVEEYGWRIRQPADDDKEGSKTRWLRYHFSAREQPKAWDQDAERMAAYRRLAMEMKEPVFLVERQDWRTAVVVDRIPVLSEIEGVAAKYPPVQIYQNIAHFLANTIKENPDGAPISTITDKEKVESKGFDIRRSFRPKMK